jgi:hypothetical protein
LKIVLVYLIVVFGFSLQNKTYSQQGKSDATFNVYDDGLQGDGFDNTVRTVSVQSDSKLIVGAIISILTELQLLIYVDCFKTGLRTPL